MGIAREILGGVLQGVVGEAGEPLFRLVESRFKGKASLVEQALQESVEGAFDLLGEALDDAERRPLLTGLMRSKDERDWIRRLRLQLESIDEAGDVAVRRQGAEALAGVRARVADEASGFAASLLASAAEASKQATPQAVQEALLTAVHDSTSDPATRLLLERLLVQQERPGSEQGRSRPLLLEVAGAVFEVSLAQDAELAAVVTFRHGVAASRDRREILDGIRELRAQVEGLRGGLAEAEERTNVARKAVSPELSFSIRDAREKELIKKVLRDWRQLPAHRRDDPALRERLGRLRFAEGNSGDAAEHFAGAARTTTSDKERARLLEDAHLAALEARDMDLALRHLREFVALDPMLSPFPERYTIERILGSGGFSTVFLAEDHYLAKPVVLKSLRADALGRSILELFEEARTLQRLRHAGVVHLEDVGESPDGRRPYLKMPFVKGETLRELLEREGTLPWETVRDLGLQAAHALQYAHGQGVVHRDVKPENILVTPDQRLLLFDFGLAVSGSRLRASEGASSHSALWMQSAAGTLRYAAPEQLAEGQSVGPKADVYALGLVLCEMLTGEVHCGRDVREAAPREVYKFLADCVERNPSHRPASFAELVTAVDSGESREGRSNATPKGSAARPEATNVRSSGGGEEARCKIGHPPSGHLTVVSRAECDPEYDPELSMSAGFWPILRSQGLVITERMEDVHLPMDDLWSAVLRSELYKEWLGVDCEQLPSTFGVGTEIAPTSWAESLELSGKSLVGAAKVGLIKHTPGVLDVDDHVRSGRAVVLAYKRAQESAESCSGTPTPDGFGRFHLWVPSVGARLPFRLMIEMFGRDGFTLVYFARDTYSLVNKRKSMRERAWNAVWGDTHVRVSRKKEDELTGAMFAAFVESCRNSSS